MKEVFVPATDDEIHTYCREARHRDTFPMLPTLAPSRDPNAFYYKPDRPLTLQSSFSLECDQWRHEEAEECFSGELHFALDQDAVPGMLECRIQAENLSEAASLGVPVRITIKSASAFDLAQAAVDSPSGKPPPKRPKKRPLI